MHRKMFPLYEFQEEEIDVEYYKHESLVSSDGSLRYSYTAGFEMIKEYLKSKENVNPWWNMC